MSWLDRKIALCLSAKRGWFTILLVLATVLLFVTEINEQILRIGFFSVLMYLLLILILSKQKHLYDRRHVRWLFTFISFYFLLYPFVMNVMVHLMGYSHLGFTFNIEWETVFDILHASDQSETSEYLGEHGVMIAKNLLLWLLTATLVWKVAKKLITYSPLKQKHHPREIWVWLIVFLTALATTHVIPKLIWGYSDFYQAQKERESFLSSHHVKPVQLDRAKVPNKRTVVVVIGESTSRRSMGIYGYERATTPNLTAMQSQLVVFQHPLSTATHTITSLTRALSDCYQPEKQWYRYANVINIAKQLGYEVTWLSNQALVGTYDTPIGFIAKQADKVKTINYSGVSDGRYDEDLLPYLQKALKDPHAKKLIFVHTMGSHPAYAKRYPEAVQGFIAPDEVSRKMQQAGFDDSIVQERRNYDSSIRYVDAFLADVIHLSEQEQNATETPHFVMYFSDHGQDVGYYSHQRVGHSHAPSGYQIPLIMWPKQQLLQDFPAIAQNRKKLVGLDSLHLMITDLLGSDIVGEDVNNPFNAKYDRKELFLNGGVRVLSESDLKYTQE